MLIALNGQYLLKSHPAGPEKYTYNLYQELPQIDKNNRYLIYFSEQPSPEYWNQLSQQNKNISYRVVKPILSWTHLSLPLRLATDQPDIFFSPVHTLPLLKMGKTKYVAMIHGLEFQYKKSANLWEKLTRGKPEYLACKNAGHIIVPTQATKDEILKMGWSEENTISIVNEGVGKEFYKRTAEEIAKVRDIYKITAPQYLIFVGTVQPRKNLETTIKVFSSFVKQNQLNDLNLLICGKNGWDYQEILNAPKKYRIEKQVKFLGRIPEEDLPALISGAKALVNFSLMEGFGLPLLEAMACKVPCAVSNIKPFQEVGEGVCIFAQDSTEAQMQFALHQVIYNQQDDLIARAKLRADRLSWKKTAEETLAVFHHVVKNV